MNIDEQLDKALDFMTPYCPVWVAKIREGDLDFEATPQCDLSLYEFCICGYCHKNSSDYDKCDVCHDYAKELYRSACIDNPQAQFPTVTNEFKKVFINFTEHWKDHVAVFQENIRLQRLQLEDIKN